MPSLDVIRTLTLRAKIEGDQEVVRGLQQIEKAEEGVASATATVEKSTGSLEKSFKGIQSSLDPVYAAMVKYERQIQIINAAQAKGLTTPERANALLEASESRFVDAAGGADKFTKSLGDMEKAHAGLSGQSQALAHAFRSFFDSVAAGQAPLTALTQQMGHLQFAASGDGGLKGAFSGVSSMFSGVTRFITPVTVGIGAVATGLAAATAAAVRYADGQHEVEVGLRGLGRTSGQTVASINQVAETTAASSGISVKAAREIATGYASVGKIGTESLAGLTGATADFAATTKTDFATAQKTLAAAFADPVKGFDDLNAQVNFGTAANRDYIQSLVNAGQQEQARVALLANLKTGLVDYGSSLQAVTKLWETLSATADRGADILGKEVKGVFAPDADQAIDRLKGQRQSLTAAKGPDYDYAAEIADIDRLIAAQEALKKSTADTARAEAEAGQMRDRSIDAQKIVAGIYEEIAAYDKLTQQLNTLTQALEDNKKAGGQMLGANTKAVSDAQESIQVRRDAMRAGAPEGDPVQSRINRGEEDLSNQIAQITALGAAQVQAAAAQEALTQARRNGATAAEQQLAVEKATQPLIAKQEVAERNRTTAFQANLATINAVTQAQKEAAAGQQAYNSALLSGASAEQANLASSQAMTLARAKDSAATTQILRQSDNAERNRTLTFEANLAAIKAVTQAEKEAAAGLQAYNAALISGAGAEQAKLASSQAMTLARAKDSAAAAQTLRQLDAQVQAVRAVTIAEKARAAAAVAKSQHPEDSLEGEAAALAASTLEWEKYNAATKAHIQDQRDTIELQAAEANSMGMSDQARAAMLAGMKEEQQLRRDGVSLLDSDSQARIANARAIAANAVALKENQQAIQQWIAAENAGIAAAQKMSEQLTQQGRSASLDLENRIANAYVSAGGHALGQNTGGSVAQDVDRALGKGPSFTADVASAEQKAAAQRNYGGNGTWTTPSLSGIPGFNQNVAAVTSFIPNAEGYAFARAKANAPQLAQLQKQLQFTQSGGPGDAIVSPLKGLIENLTNQVKNAVSNDNVDPMANASKSDPQLDPYLSRNASVYYGTATDQFYKEISWQEASLTEFKTQTDDGANQLAALEQIARQSQAMAANTDPEKVAQFVANGLRQSGFVEEAAEVLKQAQIYAINKQIEALQNPTAGATAGKTFGLGGGGGGPALVASGGGAGTTANTPIFSNYAFLTPHAAGADLILPGAGGEQPYTFSAQPGERLQITPKGGGGGVTFVDQSRTQIFGVTDTDALLARLRQMAQQSGPPGISKAAMRAARLAA